MSLGLLLGVGIALADITAANLTEPLDKIVAVVGTRPLFLSEVRYRARPHFHRIDALGGDKAKRSAEKTNVMREIVNRIIDERLEEQEADKAHISVTSAEIDDAIKMLASQSKLSKEELMAEVKRQKLSEQDYRDEIRRQILEGKLIQLRVRPKVKVTDADARKAYDGWVKEQRESDPIDLRTIALHIEKGATPAAKETLAQQIVAQARSGTDFCALVTKHTEDASTKSTCGSSGPTPRSRLFPEIAKATSNLKPGEIAGPITFTDPSGAQAVLVIQRAPGSSAAVPPPAFEKVKDKMMERAHLEALERERKSWLAELRQHTFIEMKP